MNNNNLPHFILIDDDPICNIICHKIIQTAIPGAEVRAFTDADKGIKYIQSAYTQSNTGNAVLFLDINMPSLSGWDVLDRFESSTEQINERIKIFMLTSSVNSWDKEKADDNKLVSGFISKPLPGKMLQTIVSDYFS